MTYAASGFQGDCRCFYVCVVDGVFEAQPDGVTFHAAADLDEGAFRQVQANVRKRILRAFVARGHIEGM